MAALLLLAGAGCRAKPTTPQTYPVTGKVAFTNGKPVTGGLIEFLSKTNSQLTVKSPIGTDGSFSLRTTFSNGEAPGAVEGEYRVIVNLPMGEDQQGASVPAPGTYKVEPRENEFRIQIAPPRD